MKHTTFALKLLALFICAILIMGLNVAYAQPGKKPLKDTLANCGCPPIKFVDPGLRYFPSLDYRITFPSLKKATTWQLFGAEKSFRLLFMKYDQFSANPGNFRNDLTIISPRDPVKIVHPDNTFTINLTPCPNENRNYELPLLATGKQKILEDIRDFDYSQFENSTRGYVHLFMQMSGKRPDQMIRIAIKNLGHNYGLNIVNEAIAKMNKEFETGIPPVTEKTYQDSLTISGILDSLVSKKLRQERVLTDAFVLSAPGVHPPNSDEQYKMELLFQSYCPYYAFQLFDTRKLMPDFEVDFYNQLAAVELSSNIITQRNPNPGKNLGYDEVWIDFRDAKFTSEAGLEINIGHACLPLSVIAGTSIAIDFNKAGLFTDPTQNSREFDYGQFPQLAKRKGNKSGQTNSVTIEYDTLLSRFSGLMVKDALFQLPVGSAVFKLKGQNVMINNRIIAGCIVVDLAPKISGRVLIKQVGGVDKTVSIAGLLAALKKAGLNDFTTKVEGKQLNVYFKKTAI